MKNKEKSFVRQLFTLIFHCEKKGLYILKIALMLISIGSLCTYRIGMKGDYFSGSYIGGLSLSIFLMIVTGLYGIESGIFSFLVVFLVSLVLSPQYAFMDFFYLSIVLYTVFSMNKGMFENGKRLVRNCLLGILIPGNIAILIFDMISLESFSAMRFLHLMRDVTIIMPQIVGMILICYFLFKRIPKDKRKYFEGLYREKTQNDQFRPFNFIRKRKLSYRITYLILAEAMVLGITAAVYANMLIPTLGDHFLTPQSADLPAEKDDQADGNAEKGTVQEGTVQEGNLQEDILFKETFDKIASFFDIDMEEYIHSYGEFRNDVGQEKANMLKFVMNDAGKSFDLKLIMLILNTACPLVVLSDRMAQFMIADPITNISGILEEYTSDFEHREDAEQKLNALNVHTKDEIEMLYLAILKMDVKMNEYLERIRKDQELKEELRVAKATSDAKSSFLSNMSHEIRTPINAVLGMDEMILRETEEENILKYATDIKNSGKTLLSLVNDILDFSKIEAGKMEIIPVEYELSSVINDLINMISVKAKDKGLKLEIDVDRGIPHLLYGDEIRIKQCVTNILSNAVKYTMEGSVTMRVGYERTGENEIYLKFSVIDTGIGIKEEDLKKLYSPFERIEEKRNRTIEGTGLGMNIVKQLLALMDSELVVKSVYGEGSDFSFCVSQRIIKDEPIGDFNETYRKSIESVEKYQESFHAPDAEILVVDDTKMNLTVIRGLLKPTLVQIDTAESGRETLELITQKKYDVIFLDHRMPEMDGIETRAAMKELAGNLNTDTPCIALTANVVSGAREIYMEAGFDDYLSKPIDSVRLEKMLRERIPAEKVFLPGTKEFEVAQASRGKPSAGNGDGKDFGGEETAVSGESVFAHIEGIDYQSALANCMNEEILLEAMRDFYVSLQSAPDRIEQLAGEQNWREYTVQVHALKSSARLIGANELSTQAAYLESCGNEEKVDEIRAKTPDMLQLYRSYGKKLGDLFELGEDSDKEPISREELQQAYDSIRELVTAFDFDGADEIIRMLEDYKIPDEELDRYAIIKNSIVNVDRDAVLLML